MLGVLPSASAAGIKAAYRQMARMYHPDVNSEADARTKFQALSEAHEVLSDAELRKQYDQYGFRALNKQRFKVLLGFLGLGGDAPTSYQGKPPEKGADVHTVLGLPLNEAVTGVVKVVQVSVIKSCLICKGYGETPDAAPTCAVCRGNGKLLRTVRRPDQPSFVKLGDCPACAGRGVVLRGACTACSGEGVLSRPRAVGVRVGVPAGTVDGAILRCPAMGHSGRFGGAPGDLYIKLLVRPAANLERRGQDLHSTLDVLLFDALLGGRVSVDTPRGERMLTVPEGTQAGDVLTLQGAGVACAEQGTVAWGDHVFTVRVVVPDGGSMASEGEVRLLNSLARLVNGGGADGSEPSSPVMDKWW